MKFRILKTCLLAFLPNFLFAQVIWTEPPFPTQLDDVTVYYDATQGNGALAGFTGDVYAHAGVITSESNSGTDWKHVVGDWGTADDRVLMTREGADLYSISYNIEEFYGIPPGEEVLQLAFVFRNVNGTIVGRDTDGSDIFTDVYPVSDQLFISLISPASAEGVAITAGDSFRIQAQTNMPARITVHENGELIFQDSAEIIDFFVTPGITGIGEIEIVAIHELDTAALSFPYFVVGSLAPADPPTVIVDGLTYTDSSYFFQLYAPGKEIIFLLCDATDWLPDNHFQMRKTEDGNRFWIELPRSLFPEGSNLYQYWVDLERLIADPYSEVILHPTDDQFIPPAHMSGLPPYPQNAEGILTVFDTEQTVYDWQANDYIKPDNEDLIIYELLMRDFLGDHSYASLLDTLDYLERLGVNAIQFMPIQEFEGNLSWGYNPSFHMAVDKYYGSREDLKRVIDEAHARGIAVIQDVVFNHVFSLSPLAQLYWDSQNFRPTPESPYLNVTARHPFNVGYDVNHESIATQQWVKKVLEYWITEFRFDGFRFDLSKGFTQKNTGDNVGAWSQYDASRITILKDYADFIWSIDSTNYVILEHFADNTEEKELADYGMMLWGNMNHAFSEAAMGYSSDLDWLDYSVRGWDSPHAVGYMESHDEERMMYRLLNFGDSEGNYNTRELTTALQRVEAASTIFYTVPGPKMLWQFGETGYDYSINHCVNGTVNDNCRLDPKPIRWDYLEDWRRERLFRVTASLLHLKKEYPTFSTTDFFFNDGNLYVKNVHLNHPDMDATVIANFRVTTSDVIPKFQYPGTWYEYFTGDSIEVANVEDRITFQPGEYRVYTSKRITPPDGFTTSVPKPAQIEEITLSPNPVHPGSEVRLTVFPGEQIREIRLTDFSGRQLVQLNELAGSSGLITIPGNLSSGIYLLRVETDERLYQGKILLAR